MGLGSEETRDKLLDCTVDIAVGAVLGFVDTGDKLLGASVGGIVGAVDVGPIVGTCAGFMDGWIVDGAALGAADG